MMKKNKIKVCLVVIILCNIDEFCLIIINAQISMSWNKKYILHSESEETVNQLHFSNAQILG